jgi:NADH:ubiquinone oxidoreductase subunit 5 (subunit L)/multisubunit Na+/H+ antiporter MnhA subunit
MTPNLTQPDFVPEALTPEPMTIVLSGVAVIAGAAVAWLLAKGRADRDSAKSLGGWRPVLAAGFGMDTVYRWVAILPFHRAVRLVLRLDDRVVTGAVHGAGRSAMGLGRATQQLQLGDAQRYLSATLTAVVLALVLILVAVAT